MDRTISSFELWIQILLAYRDAGRLSVVRILLWPKGDVRTKLCTLLASGLTMFMAVDMKGEMSGLHGWDKALLSVGFLAILAGCAWQFEKRRRTLIALHGPKAPDGDRAFAKDNTYLRFQLFRADSQRRLAELFYTADIPALIEKVRPHLERQLELEQLSILQRRPVVGAAFALVAGLCAGLATIESYWKNGLLWGVLWAIVVLLIFSLGFSELGKGREYRIRELRVFLDWMTESDV